jgi:thioredoxin reductase (NADPH)
MTRAPVALEPLDAADPYARMAQVNPVLAGEHIERVRAFGFVEAVPADSFLFRRGERGRDFVLVLSGSIEIFDLDEHGEERVIIVHGPGQFTGELDLFTDHPILVSARTGADAELVRVPRAEFHRMLTAEPDIAEIIIRAYILRRVALVRHSLAAVVVVGAAHSADALRVQTFLTRSGYPHRLLDSAVPGEAHGMLEAFALSPDDLPVVIDTGGRVLKNPSNAQLAEALGITEQVSPDHVYDLAVVGAGPAGLAAAVYGASEGLDTIVLESSAPGGQAATSSKIENYLGFPTGISGQSLAGRAWVQAQKFGARFAVSRAAVGIDCARSPYRVRLEGDQIVRARTIVVATGARYRTLDVPGYARFEGQGIHYAATAMEAGLCAGSEVVVVGGGNSAGQAAVFLSRTARHVHVVVRGVGLAATMSNYLVERIDASARITVHTCCEITALGGDGALREVTWTDRRSGKSETHSVGALFTMIGALPSTEWLGGCVELDDKGFVVTGRSREGRSITSPFETSVPGIFAVGDVRSGSTKRVAASVGEGSVVVQAVHRHLDPSVV